MLGLHNALHRDRCLVANFLGTGILRIVDEMLMNVASVEERYYTANAQVLSFNAIMHRVGTTYNVPKGVTFDLITPGVIEKFLPTSFFYWQYQNWCQH